MTEQILSAPAANTEAAPATTSTPEVSPVAQAPSTPAPEWVSSIDESLRGEATLHKFKSPSELAKSYIEAQKFIGSDKIAVPGKYATPEEYKKVFSKLGLPESADKYEINLKNKEVFSDTDIKGLKEVAHKNNLLPSQVQALAEYLEQDATAYNNTIVEKATQEAKANMDSLKQEWGDKYESKVDDAKFAIKHFGGDDMLNHIVNMGMSSDRQLISFLAKIGGAFKGDTLPGATQINNSGRMTPGEASNALDGMRLNPIAMDANHPQHAAMVRDMERLAVLAYPESKE